MPALSKRAQSLGTENAFVVLAEVTDLMRKGADIISFCIGQPDFPTPLHVQEAGIRAIREGKHGYTPSSRHRSPARSGDEIHRPSACAAGCRSGRRTW